MDQGGKKYSVIGTLKIEHWASVRVFFFFFELRNWKNAVTNRIKLFKGGTFRVRKNRGFFLFKLKKMGKCSN